jgi:hypothetical protein
MNIIRPIIMLLLCAQACCSVANAQLPANDSNKYQTIVVGSHSQGPVTWFDEVPELAKIKAATAFTQLKPKANPEAKDGLFEARYKSTLGTETPIVAYLRPDGGVIYFADRHSMPTRDKLYSEIKAAHQMATKAIPATQPQSELTQSEWEDFGTECPDGSCDVPQDNSTSPRFPRLRPLKNPFDGSGNATRPIDRILTGWFSDSITSGIFLVFAVVCLMVIVLFSVLIFGAMIVVVRWVVK